MNKIIYKDDNNTIYCAFKKLEESLNESGYHEFAIIVNYLMFLWLKNSFSN